MRRDEIDESILRVTSILKESQVVEALVAMIRAEKNIQPAIQAFHIISQSLPSLLPVDRQLMEIMGISKLLEPDWWGALIANAEKKEGIAVRRMVSAIGNVQEYLPRLHSLFGRQSDTFRKKLQSPRTEKSQQLIDFIFPDDPESPFASVDQVRSVLSAIQDLYDEFSRALGKENPANLRVLALDSGSSIKISIFGDGDVLGAVKRVFVMFWNRLLMYDENKSALQIENISKALPTISAIDDLLKNGAFNEDEAKAFKHRVASALGVIITSGATIPEVRVFATHAAQSLNARPQPLLTHGKSTKTGGGSENVEEADAEEVENETFISDDENEGFLDI